MTKLIKSNAVSRLLTEFLLEEGVKSEEVLDEPIALMDIIFAEQLCDESLELSIDERAIKGHLKVVEKFLKNLIPEANSYYNSKTRKFVGSFKCDASDVNSLVMSTIKWLLFIEEEDK